MISSFAPTAPIVATTTSLPAIARTLVRAIAKRTVGGMREVASMVQVHDTGAGFFPGESRDALEAHPGRVVLVQTQTRYPDGRPDSTALCLRVGANFRVSLMNCGEGNGWAFPSLTVYPETRTAELWIGPCWLSFDACSYGADD